MSNAANGDAAHAHLIDAARRAAPAFGLDPVSVAILQRSENVVCALTAADGSKTAMRLHRPGYNTIAELRSEVQWVQALAAAGIPVPRAVPTVDGDHYSPVDIEINGQSIEHQVGVVEWVNGSPLGAPLEAADQDVTDRFERIGELAAQVRGQSESWSLPSGFVRRSWDADAFVGESPLWGRFWESPALTVDQRKILTAARDKLGDELRSWSTERDRFGLIHADLHLGNVMADADDVTLIDFDDAGFGWYAYELAVPLENISDQPWYAKAREALLAGYRSFHVIADEEVSQIDTLITMRTLMIVGWLTARPELPAYQHLGEVVNDAVAAAEAFV